MLLFLGLWKHYKGRERQSLVGEAPPGEVRGIRMSEPTETLTLLHVLIELHMITDGAITALLFCERTALKGSIPAPCQRQKCRSSLHGTCFACLWIKPCLGALPLLIHTADPNTCSWMQGCNPMKHWLFCSSRKIPEYVCLISWNKSCCLAFFSPHKKWSSLYHNK